MGSTDQRTDPFRGFNFRVEIDKIATAAFSEVSGLTADGDAVDYREGTDPDNTHRRLPALRKYSTLVFKRGYVKDNTLWKWYENIANGKPDRRHGSVILCDEKHKDVMRWDFENAWINKIEGPSLKAMGNEVAIESMELIHEGLTFDLAPAAT